MVNTHFSVVLWEVVRLDTIAGHTAATTVTTMIGDATTTHLLIFAISKIDSKIEPDKNLDQRVDLLIALTPLNAQVPPIE